MSLLIMWLWAHVQSSGVLLLTSKQIWFIFGIKAATKDLPTVKAADPPDKEVKITIYTHKFKFLVLWSNVDTINMVLFTFILWRR